MSNVISPHATREAARDAGAKRFFTGKPCKHGHTAERFVSNNGCVDCINWKAAPMTGTNVRPLTRPLAFGRPNPTPGLLEFVQLRAQRSLRAWEAEYDTYRAAGWTDEQLHAREADELAKG